MKKMIFLLLTMVFILPDICFPLQIKLIKVIQIPKELLFVSGYFVVLETGSLLFTDIRDQNNQLKLFNENGQLEKSWGKMGPGPEEFDGLGYLDYQAPFLAIADAGKRKIYLFEISGNGEFLKLGEIGAWEMNGPIKIYDKNKLLITGYNVSSDNRGYAVFMRDLLEKDTRYVLPNEYKFGAKSEGEHKRIFEEVRGLSWLSYLDVFEDTAFYISSVRLKVVKINLKSGKIELFGKTPGNFRPVSMDKRTREALIDPRKGKEIQEKIFDSCSFVGGIFVDKEFVAIIYVNREKTLKNSKYFVPYVQLYDHAGKLLNTIPISEFYSEENFTPLFYNREDRLLYLCSIIYNYDAIQYAIYKYKVEQ